MFREHAESGFVLSALALLLAAAARRGARRTVEERLADLETVRTRAWRKGTTTCSRW